MSEVDKQITFIGFHICIVASVINLAMNCNYDYIINCINYLINVATHIFWFIVGMFVYLLFSQLQTDLGFHATVKFYL
jgi:hypothetical protein